MKTEIVQHVHPATLHYWILRSDEWDTNPLLALRAFLQGAGNGPATLPRFLLSKLQPIKNMSIDEIFMFMHNHQALKRFSANHFPKLRRNPARFTLAGSERNLSMSWACDTRDKHESDARDRTTSKTTLTLLANPLEIIVRGTNYDSIRDRAGAVLGFPTRSAVQRITGKKRTVRI